MQKSNSIHCFNNKILKRKTDAQLGIPFGDDDRITFGRYKGTKMANIPAWYLLRLWDSKRATTQVLGYIAENIEIIQKEGAKR